MPESPDSASLESQWVKMISKHWIDGEWDDDLGGDGRPESGTSYQYSREISRVLERLLKATLNNVGFSGEFTFYLVGIKDGSPTTILRDGVSGSSDLVSRHTRPRETFCAKNQVLLIGDVFLRAAVSVDRYALESTPRVPGDDYSPYGLVDAVIEIFLEFAELLLHAWRNEANVLIRPDGKDGIFGPIYKGSLVNMLRDTILSTAGSRVLEKLLRSAMREAGGPKKEYSGLAMAGVIQKIMSLLYEGRANKGRLIFVPSIFVPISSKKPTKKSEQDPCVLEVSVATSGGATIASTRTVRSLIEASLEECPDHSVRAVIFEIKNDNDFKIDPHGISEYNFDGGNWKSVGLRGVGRIRRDSFLYQAGSLEVIADWRGGWRVALGGVDFFRMEDGIPTLKPSGLDVGHLRKALKANLADPDLDSLVEMAQVAARNRHGAMLIFSNDAKGEASRLGSQAVKINPTRLDKGILLGLTNMDGGVLADPKGICYAVGVILDGISPESAPPEKPGRGSRYTNPVRYIHGPVRRKPAVVVCFSADGGIDIISNDPECGNSVKHAEIPAGWDLYEVNKLRKAAYEFIFGLWRVYEWPRELRKGLKSEQLHAMLNAQPKPLMALTRIALGQTSEEDFSSVLNWRFKYTKTAIGISDGANELRRLLNEKKKRRRNERTADREQDNEVGR